ncbi:MAG: Yip1 family protein [Burkholderiales bacterium]
MAEQWTEGGPGNEGWSGPEQSIQTVERAKNILLKPKQEWLVIEPETTSTQTLYKKYIAPLAAIGPLCAFIGFSVIGMSVPLLGTYRTPIGAGIGQAIASFAFALVAVYLISLIINALAPTFGARKDQGQALKVAAYSLTPSWVAGFLLLIPALGMLGVLLSLYGLYLLYHGLMTVMKAPREKTLGYTVVVVICAILMNIVFAFIAAALIGVSGPGAPMPAAVGSAPAPGMASGTISQPAPQPPNSGFEKLDTLSKQMEAAAAKAEKGGPDSAQAMGDMLAALSQMAGGSGKAEVVAVEDLRALLPADLPGMKRLSAEAEKSAAMAAATGLYQGGDKKRITVKIEDTGNLSGLAAMASNMDNAGEKITDTGYEKTTTFGDRKIREKYDRKSNSGAVSMMIGERFKVEAEGSGVDVGELKNALGKVDVAKLEAMKTEAEK